MPSLRTRLRAARRNFLLTFVVCILAGVVISKLLGITPREGGRIVGYVFAPLSMLAIVVGLLRPGGKEG